MADEFSNPRHYTDHSRFGGTISLYDYEGYNSISDIAQRIISDQKFDRMCAQNIEGRKYRNKTRKDKK